MSKATACYEKAKERLGNPSIEDLIYLAGIVDGEGCIYITSAPDRGRQTYQAGLNIANTDPRLIRWLSVTFRLGNVHPRDYASIPINHRPAWVWSVLSQQARTLLEAVRPYLKLKQEQADLLIAFAALRAQSVNKYRGPRSHAQQEEMASVMKGLNHRPWASDEVA